MARGDKLLNEYAAVLYDSNMYASVPKAVFAALIVSYTSAGGDLLQTAGGIDQMLHNIAEEWRILHENGIVPQRPNKTARDILSAGRNKEEDEMRKHTDGPFTVTRDTSGPLGLLFHVSGPYNAGAHGGEGASARARMEAAELNRAFRAGVESTAAPELLTACRALVAKDANAEIQSTKDRLFALAPELEPMARTAIAKAQGEGGA